MGLLMQVSFASKVMDHVSFGFAARCEAVASPGRQQPHE
jgi:hypothetical protein